MINKRIPAAKAIDDYQDSLSRPGVKAPRDFSGFIFVGLCLAFPVAGLLNAAWEYFL